MHSADTVNPSGDSRQGRVEFSWHYLSPLLVYFAAGFSGITTIATTFFVKERLSLSAEFLAALAFWVGLPWTLKVPAGHAVDLFWRFKPVLILTGAVLVATQQAIMLTLLRPEGGLPQWLAPATWFVVAAALGPIGFMLQDTVADAMTVDAVRHTTASGPPPTAEEIARRHSAMQSFGRMAIIAGTVLVGLVNLAVLPDANASLAARSQAYQRVFLVGLAVPGLTVVATFLAWMADRRGRPDSAQRAARPPVQWQIVWLGAGFAAVSIVLAVGRVPASAEITAITSLAIVIYLLTILLRRVDAAVRRGIVATAATLFIFRAMPTPGAGMTWWMIDVLNFDPSFMATLDLWSNVVALLGLWLFRRFVGADIGNVLIGLALGTCLLTLPNIGMFYGLHNWTALKTNGVIDARVIALADTTVESPMIQLAWIPMLAWIAHSAPEHAKATYFALMSSLFNVARSCSHLLTSYLNAQFVITREVRDPASGAITTNQDYSELGMLMIVTLITATVVPIVAVRILKPRISTAADT